MRKLNFVFDHTTLISIIMESDFTDRRVTPRDVARFIGYEQEYNDALLEQQLKQVHDSDEYEVIDLSVDDDCCED